MAEKFFIHESFDTYASQDFLISSDLTLTYEDTYKLIKQTIPIVQNLPIKKNRFVGIICDPTIHTIINIFSVFLSGKVAVLLSYKEPEAKLSEMLQSIDCSCILDKQSIPSANVDRIEIDTENDATVLFSSGSTAKPKAIVHSFANHFYSALGSNVNIPLESGDRWLLSLPLSHVSGLSILFRSLLAGSAIVLQESSISLHENIEKHNITHLSLVDIQLKSLLESKIIPTTLKSILVGGSKISHSLIKKAVDCRLPIRTTYGSTEMASQITTSYKDDSLEKLFTSGKVLSHREITIGEDSEILVRGKTLCKNYLNAEMPIDKDGWFHTSDIGSIDTEGYLTVIGRKDNMFISGGENIYPEEIEILLHMSGLFIDVVVVDKSDAQYGQVPVIFYSSFNDVTLDGIQKYLSDKLPRFKIPKELIKIPDGYQPLGIKANRQFLKNWLEKH